MGKTKIITARLIAVQRELPNGELVQKIRDYMDGLNVDSLAAEALAGTQAAFIYEGAFKPAAFEYQYSEEEKAELSQPDANKIMQKPIRVPVDLLAGMDDAARRLNITRSSLIRFAVSGQKMKLSEYRMPDELDQRAIHRRQEIMNQAAA